MSEIKDIFFISCPALLGLLFYFLFALLNEDIFLFLGICSFFLFLINGLYQVIQENKPSNILPEEIKRLNEFFENEEIKEYLQQSYNEHHQGINYIARRIEKKYKIDLYYKKGNLHGSLKPGLYEKIKDILGYEDIDLFWETND
jgi:hypothetical protein